jgi:hypothetical protein
LSASSFEVLGEVAEFPLGLYVFGPAGNIATLGGATADGSASKFT